MTLISKTWGLTLVIKVVAGALAVISVQAVENTPLEAGMTAVRMLDFSGGAEQFKASLKVLEVGTPEWEKAMLGYAVCLHRRQPDTKSDKLSAGECYEQIIERRSGSVYWQLALLFCGRLADRVDYLGDEPRREQAVEYYARLLSSSPDSALAPYAALYRAHSRAFSMKVEDARQAVVELEEWVGGHADNALASVQWLLIADLSYYPLKSYGAAARAMVAAEKAGLPSSVLPDEFWWKAANFALLAEDTDLAREYLEKIIRLGASGFIAPARDKLEQMKKSVEE